MPCGFWGFPWGFPCRSAPRWTWSSTPMRCHRCGQIVATRLAMEWWGHMMLGKICLERWDLGHAHGCKEKAIHTACDRMVAWPTDRLRISPYTWKSRPAGRWAWDGMGAASVASEAWFRNLLRYQSYIIYVYIHTHPNSITIFMA